MCSAAIPHTSCMQIVAIKISERHQIRGRPANAICQAASMQEQQRSWGQVDARRAQHTARMAQVNCGHAQPLALLLSWHTNCANHKKDLSDTMCSRLLTL